MKKYIIIQILCLCCFVATAQQNVANCVSVAPNPACCDGQIITDPTIPYNPNNGYLNAFDWRTSIMKASFPSAGGQWGSPLNAFIDYTKYKKSGQRIQQLFMEKPFALSIIKTDSL